MNSDTHTTATPPVIQVEEHPGSEMLVVAFTGIAAKFNTVQPFDFFKLTGILNYHRILVREPWRYCYLKGIDDTGLEGLVARLRGEIDRLKPKKVVFIGVSAGGFGSLLLGHLLQPDYVHSFSPYTYVTFWRMLSGKNYRDTVFRFPRTFFNLNFVLPKAQRKYLDLRPALTNNESKTKFYIHSCAYSSDRTRAMHVKDCPRVKIFLYPCASHNVTWGMLKNKSLKEMLLPENLENPEAVYQKHYGTFDPNQPDCRGCKGAVEMETKPAAND